jgi:mono/diheme cytochrome c family protein
MNCVKKTTSAALACYVTNYGDPSAVSPGPGDDQARSLAATVARDPAGLVATVAMEYRPGAAANRVTFFAFDDTGARVTRVVLDSEGLKTLPGACISCHGGRFNGATDSVTGGHFLPFDVDNFSYSTTAGFTLAAQQDAFRALNKLVVGAGPTAGITELVNGWYDNDLSTSGPDQDADFVPAGWSGQEVTYREVVKPYCRGCHIALDDATPGAAPAIVDFNTYSELNGYRFTAMNRVCELHDMPHAEVTRKRFWESPARGHFIGEFNLPTACN